MNLLQAYQLRVALLERGFIPIPCRDGVAAFTFRGGTPPTEGAVRSWAGLYPNHSETGIWKAGHVILVTEVPPTEAELHARTEAAAASALLNKRTVARATDRQRKASKRRLNGVQERSQWLGAHTLGRSKPWLEAGISRASWFRRRRVETGVSDGV